MKFMLYGFLCMSVASLSAMNRPPCLQATYDHLATKLAFAKRGDAESALFLEDAWNKAHNPNYITYRIYELRRLGFLRSDFTMHPANAGFIKMVLSKHNELEWSLQNKKDVFPTTNS